MSNRSFLGMGSPGAGGSINTEALLNSKSFRDLANMVTKGTPVGEAEVTRALVESGISASPAAMKEMSSSLAANFKNISDDTATALSEASKTMSSNVRSSITNINAAGFSREVQGLESSLSNARSQLPERLVGRAEGEIKDLIYLQSQVKGVDQEKSRQAIKAMRDALDSNDPSKIQAAIDVAKTEAQALSSKVPGFSRYDSSVGTQAKKVFDNIGDDFSNQAKSYIDTATNPGLAQKLDDIGNLSEGARLALSKKKLPDNFSEIGESLTALGATPIALPRGVDPAVAEGVFNNMRSSEATKKLLDAAANPSAKQKALENFHAELVSHGFTGTVSDAANQARLLKSHYANLDKQLQSASEAVKKEMATAAKSGPSLQGANIRQIAPRSKAEVDTSAVNRANRYTGDATSAPVRSNTEAPIASEVSLTSPPVAQSSRLVPYTAGALGVGGASAGTYAYMNRPPAPQPMQYTGAPTYNPTQAQVQQSPYGAY
jgi:hypothetical protein